MSESVIQDISGKTIKIETGKLAKQANGSVTIQCGDAILLCTATMSKKPKENIDFFPLTVEYVEKMYASGKIPGGFFKRETRPAQSATLTARLIDRPIRPSFPKNFYHEVQVAITVFSYDLQLPPEHLALIGSSAALSVSDIPFNGPIGAAFVCEVDGELKVNPSMEEVDRSTLEIMVAGTKDAVLMIEAGAESASEQRILEAIEVAHASIKETVKLQEELIKKCGKQKIEVAEIETDEDLEKNMAEFLGEKIQNSFKTGKKQEIEDFLATLEEEVLEKFVDPELENEKLVARIYTGLKKDNIRKVIIQKKIRPDGRKLDEIRVITSEVGILPSVHGSCVFTRGETQSLGTVTLGTNVDEQIDDGIKETIRQNYYFHYNFPPYSVGEVGFMGRTGRRELGHGALAQRALKPILPEYNDFPYTIRIVSDILESNGSSSMASVCSGSLALMDCGAPIKSGVSGIAMGLLIDGNDYVILSDIQGLEDHYGDMDFKVAGTKDGITALQLDIKVSGLSEDILRNALNQAKQGRLHILDEMNKTIDKPRSELAPSAPKIEFMKIDPEKVGILIGPGGKNIKKIEEVTSASVYVVDGTTGDISISASDTSCMQEAKRMVDLLVGELKVGEVMQAKVVKIVNFGAFVELIGTGKEALLHISKIAKERVNNVEDYLKLGDEFEVQVSDVADGKVSVTKIF